MAQPNPTTTVTNPRIAKLIELEVSGRIKPEHQLELDTYRAQGLAPKKSSGNSLTEYQGKSTGFYERAIGADRDFLAAGAGGDPVGVAGDAARAVLPANVVNSFTSPERQKAQQAKEDWIRASLRYESGAAISPAEFEGQDKIFFPQTGDSPETIAQKAKARQRVAESLKVAAGPGAADKGLSANAPLDPLAQGDIGFNQGDPGNTIVSPEAIAFQQDLQKRVNAREFKSPEEIIAYGKGKGFNIDAKDAQAAIDYFSKGGRDTVEVATPVEAGSREAAKRAEEAVANQPGGAGTAFMHGAADTVMFGLNDEFGAGVRALTSDKPTTYEDELKLTRAVKDAEAQQHPWTYTGGQLTGASIIPFGGSARTPAEMAKVGGGMGALYGLGSGTDLESRLSAGAKGGVFGAGLGYGFGKLADRYINRTPPIPPSGGGRVQEASDILQASNDLRVPVMPADAGGPTTRLLTAGAAATPGGVQPIVSAARNVQAKGGEALDRMASAEGNVLNKEAAGDAVREGALAYRNSSRTEIGKEYTRAAALAGDTRVAPNGALANLDKNIAELSEVPGGADGLAVLQSLREDLAARGTISVDGIRGMRTQLRQKFIKDGLRGSDLERRVNGAIDAASEDLVTSLRTQGKAEAANAYTKADREWADRVKNLDDVIMPIIGKKGEKSGEQIVDGLNAAAKGNNARLDKLFAVLPEDVAGDARATLINQLGRAKSGAQNADGSAFSFDTFLTNWNSIGASAKNTIFRGESRKAIDQLALLAEKSKAAGRYRNASNTGLAIMSSATAGTAFASMATLGKVLAGQYIAGRVLASPHVAKAILNIAKANNPAASIARIERLTSIATKDPTIRNEVIQLQQKLMAAVNDNVVKTGSAAASPDERPGEQ